MLVIGGGVAGLAALAQAKSMGAICRVFDTREAVREQVCVLFVCECRVIVCCMTQVPFAARGHSRGTAGHNHVITHSGVHAQLHTLVAHTHSVFTHKTHNRPSLWVLSS